MGLDIGNALSGIKDNIVDTFHKVEELPSKLAENFEKDFETVGNFVKEKAENIGDVFASRSGLATFLNPLSFRLPRIFRNPIQLRSLTAHSSARTVGLFRQILP